MTLLQCGRPFTQAAWEPPYAGAARLGCFKTILDSDKVGSGPVHY